MIVPLRYRKRIEICPFYGCWLWKGARNNNGYGRLKLDGKQWYVHRLAYLLFVGDIPHGFDIDHTCVTRNCCNPKHLRAVTHLENMQEMGRRRTGKGATQRELFEKVKP